MSTRPLDDPHLDRFVHVLEHEHSCHTVILYGSRARGMHTPTSDYDLLGIRQQGEDTRDARWINGAFLDAFIRSEKTVLTEPQAFLHLHGGVCLRDPKGMGADLLDQVTHALQSPPAEIPPAEIDARRTWCIKTIARIRNASTGDLEAQYRLHWLLVDILEFYFVLRRRHYLGPKESFRWLAEHDPAAHRAFANALKPGADIESIERMVALVVEPERSVAGS